MPLQQGKEALPPERHVTRAPLERRDLGASPPEGGVASEPRFRRVVQVPRRGTLSSSTLSLCGSACVHPHTREPSTSSLGP